MSDGSDKLWSLRGVPYDVRKLANDAADRADMHVGPWVCHAIRQTAASDRGGVAGEVVSDAPSVSSLDVLATLYAGLGQIAGQPRCGGLAQRTRALIEQRIAALALEPLPAKRGAPRRITDGNA